MAKTVGLVFKDKKPKKAPEKTENKAPEKTEK